jgi:hypothetical protein
MKDVKKMAVNIKAKEMGNKEVRAYFKAVLHH